MGETLGTSVSFTKDNNPTRKKRQKAGIFKVQGGCWVQMMFRPTPLKWTARPRKSDGWNLESELCPSGMVPFHGAMSVKLQGVFLSRPDGFGFPSPFIFVRKKKVLQKVETFFTSNHPTVLKEINTWKKKRKMIISLSKLDVLFVTFWLLTRTGVYAFQERILLCKPEIRVVASRSS